MLIYSRLSGTIIYVIDTNKYSFVQFLFFLRLASLQLLTVFIGGYCCKWVQAMTQTHTNTHTHTRIHNTLGRTPLDEGSARRRDLYLTTHNTQNRQTSRLPAGFEPAIPASRWPQTHALTTRPPGSAVFSPYNNKLRHTSFRVTFTEEKVQTRLRKLNIFVFLLLTCILVYKHTATSLVV